MINAVVSRLNSEREGGRARRSIFGEVQELCLMLESLEEEKNTTAPRKSLDVKIRYLN